MSKQHQVIKQPETYDSKPGLTQTEIAEKLGISRARVSFLERRAMLKMQNAAKRNGYTLADLMSEL